MPVLKYFDGGPGLEADCETCGYSYINQGIGLQPTYHPAADYEAWLTSSGLYTGHIQWALWTANSMVPK